MKQLLSKIISATLFAVLILLSPSQVFAYECVELERELEVLADDLSDHESELLNLNEEYYKNVDLIERSGNGVSAAIIDRQLNQLYSDYLREYGIVETFLNSTQFKIDPLNIEYQECLAMKDAEEAERIAVKQAQIERNLEITDAIATCDVDFFDNQMTDTERIDSFDARMFCKEKLAAETNQVSEPIPVYIPPVTTSIPEPVSYTAPVVSLPTAAVSQPVMQEKSLNNESPESSESDLATSSLATTSEKVIEMTEEELNRLVEERVAAAFEETTSEPEPEKTSVFRRIINFFTGWF